MCPLAQTLVRASHMFCFPSLLLAYDSLAKQQPIILLKLKQNMQLPGSLLARVRVSKTKASYLESNMSSLPLWDHLVSHFHSISPTGLLSVLQISQDTPVWGQGACCSCHLKDSSHDWLLSVI